MLVDYVAAKVGEPCQLRRRDDCGREEKHEAECDFPEGDAEADCRQRGEEQGGGCRDNPGERDAAEPLVTI